MIRKLPIICNLRKEDRGVHEKEDRLSKTFMALTSTYAHLAMR